MTSGYLICLEVYGEFEGRGWYKNATNTQLVNEILTVILILYRILLHRAFSLNIIRALELISPGFTEPFKTLSYSLTPWVCVRGGGKWRPLGGGSAHMLRPSAKTIKSK